MERTMNALEMGAAFCRDNWWFINFVNITYLRINVMLRFRIRCIPISMLGNDPKRPKTTQNDTYICLSVYLSIQSPFRIMFCIFFLFIGSVYVFFTYKNSSEQQNSETFGAQYRILNTQYHFPSELNLEYLSFCLTVFFWYMNI